MYYLLCDGDLSKIKFQVNRTFFCRFESTPPVPKWSICKWIICKIQMLCAIASFMHVLYDKYVNGFDKYGYTVHTIHSLQQNASQTHPKNALAIFHFVLQMRVFFLHKLIFFLNAATLTLHILDLFHFCYRYCFCSCFAYFDKFFKPFFYLSV